MHSTERFTSRVENYIRYRPKYPKDVIPSLTDRIGLRPDHVVADIGSGTGFSSKLFLANGNTVYAVEPNAPMRLAGEEYLHRFKNFHSVDGTAEQTTLPDSSIDMIVAGQAFHWFDREMGRMEFRRVLKPKGWVVLMWNDRQIDTTPFLRDYEALLEDYGTDYAQVNHRNIDEAVIGDFFEGKPVKTIELPNSQLLDLKGVRGRLLSSSYVPAPEDPSYQPMLNRLTQIFSRHAKEGKIELLYTTKIYAGQL